MFLSYITTEIVEFFAGRLVLNENQAARRGHALELVEKLDDDLSLFDVVGPVQFKAGEIVGLEDPDKVTRARIELTEETEAYLAKLEEDRIEAEIERRLQEKEAAERAEKIVAAARESIAAGEVTEKGLPEVKAIESRLGFDITAGERDAAVEVIEAGS